MTWERTWLSGIVLAFVLLIPPSLKWKLRAQWVVPWCLFVGLPAGGVGELAHQLGYSGVPVVVIQAAVVLGVSLLVLLWRFFRDPERRPPQDASSILSPADGTVLYIREFQAGEPPAGMKEGCPYSIEEFTQCTVFGGGGVVIGIGMSFLDVHVNRSPVAGVVRLIRRIPGRFLSLRRPEALTANERALTVIECDGVPVGVVQIASRLVRQIVSFVKEGQHVAAGERIGMIRFGSQVDLILPRSLRARLTCREGDQVYAGLSIVAQRDAGGP